MIRSYDAPCGTVTRSGYVLSDVQHPKHENARANCPPRSRNGSSETPGSVPVDYVAPHVERLRSPARPPRVTRCIPSRKAYDARICRAQYRRQSARMARTCAPTRSVATARPRPLPHTSTSSRIALDGDNVVFDRCGPVHPSQTPCILQPATRTMSIGKQGDAVIHSRVDWRPVEHWSRSRRKHAPRARVRVRSGWAQRTRIRICAA